eukprot:2391259-Rhodomonas_salina.2
MLLSRQTTATIMLVAFHAFSITGWQRNSEMIQPVTSHRPIVPRNNYATSETIIDYSATGMRSMKSRSCQVALHARQWKESLQLRGGASELDPAVESFLG